MSGLIGSNLFANIISRGHFVGPDLGPTCLQI